MQMADHLAEDGFKELGYEFINIDVCCVNSVSSISKIDAQSLTTNMLCVCKYHRTVGQQRKEMLTAIYKRILTDFPMG